MTAVVEVRSTPLLSRLLKGGWFLFRLGNTSPLEFIPKVTREVRSLLLSDLGNMSLFRRFLCRCSACFCSCLKKKKPPLQSALVVESGDSVFRPCFFRLFL